MLEKNNLYRCELALYEFSLVDVHVCTAIQVVYQSLAMNIFPSGIFGYPGKDLVSDGAIMLSI